MRTLRLIPASPPPSPLAGSRAAGPRAHPVPSGAPARGEGVTPDGRSWRCVNNDGDPPFFIFRAASELADREQAYGLGYQVYRKMGYVQQEERRLLVIPSDAHPETLVVVASDPRSRVAGTVTLWFDRPGGLPCEGVYPQELAALRETGGILVEAGRFAINDDYRHSVILLARLLNMIFLYAHHVQACTHLVCTVNPRHTAFYLRKLHFRRLGVNRPCPRVKGAIADLLVLDLGRYAREVRRAHAPAAQGLGEGEAGFYLKFLDPLQELEAAAFLTRTRSGMTPEMAAYYRLAERPGPLCGCRHGVEGG